MEKWIKGAGDRGGLADYSEVAAKWGAAGTMLWLRDYNAANENEIRFAGIDIPEAGGTIMPALSPLRDYLRKVDASLEIRLADLTEIAENFSDLSSTKAISKWKNISSSNQDKLYAGLNKIRLRFEAMEMDYVQLSNQTDYDIAFRHLKTAITTVYVLQASGEMFSGTGLPLDLSVREKFMADSVLWHLNRSDPNTRMVVFAHNNHIQKTPVQYGEYVVANPMGFYLNRHLGKDYCSLGLTTTDNHIPDMDLDTKSPVGFNVIDKEIGLPVKGSVENLLVEKGFGDKISFVNLKNQEMKGQEEIHCLRSQGSYITTPSIKETFDGLFSIPRISLDKSIEF